MTVRVYRFGDCRIDLSARELCRAGEVASLSPKVFDCIAYLIEHHERAVGRDELIAAVWGRAEVSDTLLGQTVLKARRAVGDDGNEQRAIRTIPRFGYRWIAPLTAASAPIAPTSAATALAAQPTAPEPAGDAADTALPVHVPTPAPKSAPSGPRRHAAGLIVAGALLLALATLLWWQLRPAASDVPAAAAPSAGGSLPTLAVLPVEVGSAPQDWAWLRLGLMDLIANHLRHAGLIVVPSDNVVALAHRDDSAATGAAVGAATGAHLIVVPSVSRRDGQWNVRLLLQRDTTTVHEVQAQAADAIVAARRASDRLLAQLDRQPTGTEAADLPLDELLSRADAALFTDDLDGARNLLEQAPPALRERPELRLRLAQIAFRGGHFEDAATRLQALLHEVGAEAEPVLRGRILNGIGATAVRQNQLAVAGRAFAEAVTLLETRQQPAALGQAYMGLAISAAAQGDYGAAQGNFSRARVALELAGDGLALARVEENEGIMLAKRGHLAEALAAHETAARSFERFGALNELVDTLGNAAGTQLALLQPSAALATVQRALPLLERLENRNARHGLQVEQVAALIQNGQLGQAQALLTQLFGEIGRGGDPITPRLQLEQARLDFDRGNYADAAQLAQSASDAFDDADSRLERSWSWLLLTQALRAQQRDGEADQQTARFAAWASVDAQPPMQEFAELARAEQAWATHDLPAAHKAYEAALASAAQHDMPAATARIVVSYGNRLLATGELDRAGSVVGQVARWAGQDFRCALLQLRYYHALGETDAWRSALARVQALAGERAIALQLLQAPAAARKPIGRP